MKVLMTPWAASCLKCTHDHAVEHVSDDTPIALVSMPRCGLGCLHAQPSQPQGGKGNSLRVAHPSKPEHYLGKTS